MEVNKRIVGSSRDGSFYVKGSDIYSEYENTQKALEKLSAYEDTGLSPKEIEALKLEYELNKKALYKIASGELKNLKSLERIVEQTAPREGKVCREL